MEGDLKILISVTMLHIIKYLQYNYLSDFSWVVHVVGKSALHRMCTCEYFFGPFVIP